MGHKTAIRRYEPEKPLHQKRKEKLTELTELKEKATR